MSYCTMTYVPGAGYCVQAYKKIGNERFSSWHTLRAFLMQGDAILFKERCNTDLWQHVDVYIKSFKVGTIVHSMKSNGIGKKPTLHVSTIEGLKV